MKHYGDITKLSGWDLPIVDVVTGGSPCQDLSVAGKRAGLSGERSGLFMEQIRIIKEMREHDKSNGRTNELIRPRYMVWENVPGALSSGTPKGGDFRCVLEEICRVKDKTATVPMPKNGKWSNSGCILGDGEQGVYSISWRLHDAQFWGKTIRSLDTGDVLVLGTPQRRRRIALVADFGGESAPEILFERSGVSGDSEQSEQKGEETAGTVGNSLDPSSYTLKIRGGVDVDSHGKKAGKGALIQTELSGTLGVSQDQTLIQTDSKCLNPWDVQSKHIQPEDGKAEALYSGECRYGGGESYVMQEAVCIGNGQLHDALSPDVEVSKTLNCLVDPMKVMCIEESDVVVQDAYCVGNGQLAQAKLSEKVGALNCMHDQQAVLAIDRASFNQGKNAKYDISIQEEIAQPIVARGPGGVLTEQLEPYAQETTKE